MGGDDERPYMALDNGQDPLLRMHFFDPLGSKARKAEAPPAKEPSPKKPRVAASSSTSATKGATKGSNGKQTEKPANHGTLLHQSCRLFPQCAAVLESAIEMEGADKALQRADPAVKSLLGGAASSYLVGDGREPYSLPINILLHRDASLEAIGVVARAAPKALLMKDGREQDCSLIISLRLRGSRTKRTQDQQDEDDTVTVAAACSASNTTAHEEILSANPEAAQVPDKRRNFPLHVAAYVGASFTVINKLYYAFPEALLETNFHGETPLDIAIRNGKCSDIATNFLQEKMDHLKSARMRSLRC